MAKKSVIIIILLTLLSKLIGFFRDIILAYFYGASEISDVFLISLLIPSVIFGFIGTGIYSAFIPIYSKIESEYGVKEGNHFTNNLINSLLIFSTIMVIIFFLFTEPIIKVFASGFEGQTMDLAIQFSRITITTVYFTGIIYIFSGFLQTHGNHIVPSLMGLPLNLGLILGVILSSSISIYILPLGKVVAIILQFIFLAIFVYKNGFMYKPKLDFSDKHLRKMMMISFPVILSSSVEQINKLIDRTLASSISVGGISALNYANQLNLFIQGIFVASISTVFFPIMSKMAANNDMTGLRKSLSKTLIVISVMLIPATIGSIVFSEPIVKLLFGRGAFTKEAVDMTSTALFFYSIGMVSFGLRMVLNRAFYSLQDTKTPMKNSILTVILNIILNIILSRYFGIGGLALATSISGIFCTCLLFIDLKKKIGYYKLKKMLATLAKIVTISVLMGALSKLTFQFLDGLLHPHLGLFISVCFGVLFYGACISFLRIEEVDDFIYSLKRKLGKAKI